MAWHWTLRANSLDIERYVHFPSLFKFEGRFNLASLFQRRFEILEHEVVAAGGERNALSWLDG